MNRSEKLTILLTIILLVYLTGYLKIFEYQSDFQNQKNFSEVELTLKNVKNKKESKKNLRLEDPSLSLSFSEAEDPKSSLKHKKSKPKKEKPPPKPKTQRQIDLEANEKVLTDQGLGKSYAKRWHDTLDLMKWANFSTDFFGDFRSQEDKLECSKLIKTISASESANPTNLMANKEKFLKALETKNYLPENKAVPQVILGILTTPDRCNERALIRSTWGKYGAVDYRFLVDQPSEMILQENKTFGDIISLNANWSGKALRFGEKLYWF